VKRHVVAVVLHVDQQPQQPSRGTSSPTLSSTDGPGGLWRAEAVDARTPTPPRRRRAADSRLDVADGVALHVVVIELSFSM